MNKSITVQMIPRGVGARLVEASMAAAGNPQITARPSQLPAQSFAGRGVIDGKMPQEANVSNGWLFNSLEGVEGGH